MSELLRQPRVEGGELIIETQSQRESYDARYMLAALLVYVARGDGNISGEETSAMIDLVSEHFGMANAESLALLAQATGDIATNPDFESLLRELSRLLNEHEKEEAALMMLKVAAADGRREAEELDSLRHAAFLIGLSDETLHRAYDRYFEETQVD